MNDTESFPLQSLAQSALLLVGHGSSRIATSRIATSGLAAFLRNQGKFSEVQECYWREEPYVSLDLVTAPQVYVVPNFSGDGAFTRHLIPQKLGLTGRVTILNGRRVIYCDPLGTHPRIPQLLRHRVETLCAGENLAPSQVSLLIIGHGSSKPGGSTGTPEKVAAALRSLNLFAEVMTAYIEQSPFVAEWPQRVAGQYVVAVPLLVSEGAHASEDLPPLFGLDQSQGGPTESHGRTVWLTGGFGRNQDLAEIVLALIAEAEQDASRHAENHR